MPQPDITIPDLALRARRRADMVGSSFVTDSEVDGYAEQAWREFYMRLVSKFEDYFVEKDSIGISAGIGFLVLGADFLKVRGVRHPDEYFLGRVDVKEIPNIATRGRTGKPTHYWVHGSFRTNSPRIEVFPTNDVSRTVDVYYVPLWSLADVTAGSVRFVAGWDEYIVLSMAIKMKDKEESDCSVIMAERAQLLEVIEKSMTPLDAAEPGAVVQSLPRQSLYDDPFALEDYYG